jgi:hypothetical protein
MQKEMALACIIGPFYLVYGLSILMYPRQWKKVVAWLEKDHFAFLPLAMLGLIFGLILVNAYNIWDWNVFVIITVTGWAILFKAAFYFLAPGKWITALLRWRALAHLSYYYFAGAVLTAMGGALAYYGYFGK